MMFSLFAMLGLEKCCITSACLQWLCHSGEETVARGPLVVEFVDQSINNPINPINCASLSNTPKYWDRQASAKKKQKTKKQRRT